MARKFLIFDGKREWWLDRFDLIVVACLLSSLVLAGDAQQGLFPSAPSLSPQDIQLDSSGITVAILLALYVVLMPALAFAGSFMKARARQPLAARVYSIATALVLLMVLLQSWTHVSYGAGFDRMLASRYAGASVDELWEGYESGRIPEQAYFQACQEAIEAAIAADLEPVQCVNPVMPATRLELEPTEAGLEMARYRLDIQDNTAMARKLLWMQSVLAALVLVLGLAVGRRAIVAARKQLELEKEKEEASSQEE